MGNKVVAKVEGAAGLINKLKLLVPAVRRATQDAVATTALQIESTAKELAPVDTGRLRASIGITFAPDRLSAQVGSNVSYSPFIEFGTSRMRAQPFLAPAFEQHRTAFLANLKQALKVSIF